MTTHGRTASAIAMPAPRRAVELAPEPRAEVVDGVEAGVEGPDGTRWTLRMKDLSEATGLHRQAIHFYIKEGLLPAGHKSSKNMAWYGQVHLERLRLVRRLQHERFLPLRAIKAVLDEQHEQFSPDQQAFIREVKQHAARALRGPDRVERLAVDALLEANHVTGAELAELDRMGLSPVVEGPDGTRYVAAEDAWVFETVGELRALGFTEAAGFAVSDFALYEEVIARLFESEKALLAQRLTRFPADRAAAMVERVLPLVHRFLERYHEAKIRRFFAAWE